MKLWQPMTHPAITQNQPPRTFESAHDVYIVDTDGREVLDAVGGLWNVNLGYSCQSIKDAIYEQLNRMPYYSSFTGVTTSKALELSEQLVDWFKPEAMERVFFTSGGSDSVETALRLARQYHKIRGDKDRYKFISLKKGYHGTHFGGASVNGNAKFRRNYEPLLQGCFQVTSPYAYRNPFDETDPERLAQLCFNQLADEIGFQGPDTVAAVIMEPVLGAGGVIVPHSSFMPKVRELCSKHGILLIADEVITAFGRTGAWTGSRLWDVQPDMICTAKGITNGYYPFGATLLAGQVVETFENNSDAAGDIGHGYTYSAHPVGAAAALATLEELKHNNLAERAGTQGVRLEAGLNKLFEEFEIFGDVRGIGLMRALEIVEDPTSKVPMNKKHMNKIGDAIYEAGVCVRISGNNIILSPPLIIADQHVDQIVDALRIGLAVG